MEKKKLNNAKNINLNKIDMDTFGESLLLCAPHVKTFCQYIDEKILRMANTPFIPYVSAAEQYEKVIESMMVKRELITFFKIFKKWYLGLSTQKRKLYIMYFVKKEGLTWDDKPYRKDRAIMPMIRSFVTYLKATTEFDERELVRNPYIYGTYRDTLKNNKAAKKRGLAAKKGGTGHDNSANERCHCCCL